MISIIVECEPSTSKEEGVRYNWSRANNTAIEQDLTKIKWKEELSKRSVEEGWRFLRKALDDTIAKNVPSSRQSVTFHHPWMTREILKLIRKKRRKWRLAKKPRRLNMTKQSTKKQRKS
jgi:hypothetical protein